MINMILTKIKFIN